MFVLRCDNPRPPTLSLRARRWISPVLLKSSQPTVAASFIFFLIRPSSFLSPSALRLTDPYNIFRQSGTTGTRTNLGGGLKRQETSSSMPRLFQARAPKSRTTRTLSRTVSRTWGCRVTRKESKRHQSHGIGPPEWWAEGNSRPR